MISVGLVGLSGCADKSVTGTLEQWECTESECSVVLLLSNESHRSCSFTYSLRAHKVRDIAGRQGAYRNEIVGEFVDEGSLQSRDETRITQRFRVLGKPTQIVLSVVER